MNKIFVKVVSAAEDCGNVLATHVSSATCRKVLIAVIRSDAEEQKVHTAIKMLTKVIESLSAPELELVLDELAPPIVEVCCFSLFCLLSFWIRLCVPTQTDHVGNN